MPRIDIRGLRERITFRCRSFIQFAAAALREPENLYEFRNFVLDYLVRGVLRGHAPMNLLGIISIRLDESPGYDARSIADSPEWYIIERAWQTVNRMVEESFGQPEPFGFRGGFFRSAIDHLDDCATCREDLFRLIRSDARLTCLTLRYDPVGADPLADEESRARVLKNVMAEIDRLERKPDLRVIDGGSKDDG